MLPQFPILNQDIKPALIIIQKKEEPKEQLYTIKQNDTLTSIAELHSSSVERLWEKNLELTNPDLIEPGNPLKIPTAEETLQDRPMPAKIQVQQPTLTSSGGPRATADAGAFSVSGLLGSIGSVSPYGNCVDEPGVNSPRNGTNPIAWPILTQTPYLGATALWTYNHTGVVVGIWNNGDLEVRHQNYSYPQTRFPRSAFRGFR